MTIAIVDQIEVSTIEVGDTIVLNEEQCIIRTFDDNGDEIHVTYVDEYEEEGYASLLPGEFVFLYGNIRDDDE